MAVTTLTDTLDKLAAFDPTPFSVLSLYLNTPATCAVPIFPAAPGRFSMMTGCFQIGLRPSATMRGTASAVPPAGKGTIIFTA